MDLFGVKKRGDDHFYDPQRDFLACTPEVVVKGAAYAADKNSWIYAWLVSRSVCEPVSGVKDCLSYLLDVLEACRSNPLDEVFDESRVNPIVYQAVMMGVGAMVLRKFNHLFRTFRFTDVKTKGVLEPTQHVDKGAALQLFTQLTEKAGGA